MTQNLVYGIAKENTTLCLQNASPIVWLLSRGVQK